MKLRYKISLGIVAVFALLLVSVAVAISYTSACPGEPGATTAAATMNAARQYCYGAPDQAVTYGATPRPEPADDEVLVKVHAAGVNPLDYHYMRGSPYMLRMVAGLGAPENPAIGVDFAGTVEAVGTAVTRFAPGDMVFGGANGAFAEYLVIREDRAITRKPDNISFEQAAGVPIAGITALQALRDHGELKAGERVLINGASGGVGTYTVQLAKAMGAHVTGVCSGRNVEMVKSIGADRVINYKEEDYTESGLEFDLIIDMVGNHSPAENQRLLSDDGRLIIVGGAKGNWFAPFIGMIKASWTSLFVDQKLETFTARMLGKDLTTLAEYMSDGNVTTVIDRIYPLEEASDAIAYSESGRARGKIILKIRQ